MTVLKSLLSSFRNSRNSTRKSRRAELVGQVTTEALEQRLLLTNPDPFDSNPGAAKTIYLDFDGHTENSNAWTGGAAAIVTPNFSADGDRTTFSLTLTAPRSKRSIAGFQKTSLHSKTCVSPRSCPQRQIRATLSLCPSAETEAGRLGHSTKL